MQRAGSGTLLPQLSLGADGQQPQPPTGNSGAEAEARMGKSTLWEGVLVAGAVRLRVSATAVHPHQGAITLYRRLQPLWDTLVAPEETRVCDLPEHLQAAAAHYLVGGLADPSCVLWEPMFRINQDKARSFDGLVSRLQSQLVPSDVRAKAEDLSRRGQELKERRKRARAVLFGSTGGSGFVKESWSKEMEALEAQHQAKKRGSTSGGEDQDQDQDQDRDQDQAAEAQAEESPPSSPMTDEQRAALVAETAIEQELAELAQQWEAVEAAVVKTTTPGVLVLELPPPPAAPPDDRNAPGAAAAEQPDDGVGGAAPQPAEPTTAGAQEAAVDDDTPGHAPPAEPPPLPPASHLYLLPYVAGRETGSVADERPCLLCLGASREVVQANGWQGWAPGRKVPKEASIVKPAQGAKQQQKQQVRRVAFQPPVHLAPEKPAGERRGAKRPLSSDAGGGGPAAEPRVDLAASSVHLLAINGLLAVAGAAWAAPYRPLLLGSRNGAPRQPQPHGPHGAAADRPSQEPGLPSAPTAAIAAGAAEPSQAGASASIGFGALDAGSDPEEQLRKKARLIADRLLGHRHAPVPQPRAQSRDSAAPPPELPILNPHDAVMRQGIELLKRAGGQVAAAAGSAAPPPAAAPPRAATPPLPALASNPTVQAIIASPQMRAELAAAPGTMDAARRVPIKDTPFLYVHARDVPDPLVTALRSAGLTVQELRASDVKGLPGAVRYLGNTGVVLVSHERKQHNAFMGVNGHVLRALQLLPLRFAHIEDVVAGLVSGGSGGSNEPAASTRAPTPLAGPFAGLASAKPRPPTAPPPPSLPPLALDQPLPARYEQLRSGLLVVLDTWPWKRCPPHDMARLLVLVAALRRQEDDAWRARDVPVEASFGVHMRGADVDALLLQAWDEEDNDDRSNGESAGSSEAMAEVVQDALAASLLRPLEQRLTSQQSAPGIERLYRDMARAMTGAIPGRRQQDYCRRRSRHVLVGYPEPLGDEEEGPAGASYWAGLPKLQAMSMFLHGTIQELIAFLASLVGVSPGQDGGDGGTGTVGACAAPAAHDGV